MRKSEKFLSISSRNAEAFKRLAEAMKGNPIALVGAGISAGAGYPTWDGLMELFHKTILELPAPPGAPKYIQQLARLTDPLWRAEEYRRLVGKAGYEALIWSTFRPRNGPVTRMLKALVNLDFSHVLTTNYDTSLETAYQSANVSMISIDWTERQKVGDFLREVSRPGAKRYLVYLHGKFDAPGNVVLTERDYVNRYLLGDEASKKLFALFMVRPVVFIGFSLTDPELAHLIRSTQGYAQAAAPTHFVILPWKARQDEGAIAGWLNGKYGIDPVFYHETPDHEQLLNVMKELLRYKSRETEEVLRRVSKTTSLKKRSKDRDDPQKGEWGGKSQANKRKLTAEVHRTDEPDWFLVKMKVEPLSTSSDPLTGQVIFHLHPTFTPDRVSVDVARGRAEYEVYSYGAFTVGAEADNGKTRLELDLSTLDDAPARFKAR